MRPFESPRLKAEGNLSYLAFIRLVRKLWMDSHPDIPLVATGDKSFPQYPIIAYRLDLRKAHQIEPKPRFREEIVTPEGEDAILLSGQRFMNLIVFTVMTETDPNLAEQVIEEFENFMIEMQPVFKKLGASELVYNRRLPDGHDTRPGEGTSSRSVIYMLTTEKIIITKVSKLEQILIDARIAIENDESYFVVNADNDSITVYGDTFSIGDIVRLRARADISGNILEFPEHLSTGDYVISNIIIDDEVGRTYTLAPAPHSHDDDSPQGLTGLGPGSGYIHRVKEYSIGLTITDQMATPNY